MGIDGGGRFSAAVDRDFREVGRHMARLYAAWRTFQEDYLRHAAALLLFGSTLLSIVEIVRRYGFGKSFAWQQDVVTYSILSSVFLFFGITQSRRLHLRVTIVLELIRNAGGKRSGRIIDGIEIFVALVGMAFCIFLVWHGLPAAEKMFTRNRMADSQLIPLWPFFFIFLTGIGLMAISFIFQLYEHVQNFRGKDPGFIHEAESGSDNSIL